MPFRRKAKKEQPLSCPNCGSTDLKIYTEDMIEKFICNNCKERYKIL